MSGHWDKLLARDSRYVVDDYERAAYRLISHQVLSAMEKGTRKDYHIVADNLTEFQQVMLPMGVTIHHDPQYQYLVAQPRHVLHQRRISKQITLLVLVLSSLHHQVRFSGTEGDFGEAHVEIPVLVETYQDMTGLDFPKTTEFRALLGDLERWGIARLESVLLDEGAPSRIVIHPAISAIVTKEWLTLLDGFRNANAETDDVLTDDDGELEDSDVSA